MGMQPGIRELFPQALNRRQQLWRRRRGKTRRDGVAEAALMVPALNELPGLPVALLRRFTQIVRSVAVHHHFTGEQTHIQPQGFGKQRIDRFGMQGTKHQRGGGAVAQQLVDKELRDLCGILFITKLTLHRKGVGGQPLQQLLAEGANHLSLRIMHVRIDKTGE